MEPPDDWSRIWQVAIGGTTLGGALFGLRHWLRSAFWVAYRVVEAHIYRERTLVSQALYIRYLEGQLRGLTKRMTDQAERMDDLVPPSTDSSSDSALPHPPPENPTHPPTSVRR